MGATSSVVADISVSLDGFVTGPGVDAEHGLGRGGEALHGWATSQDETDRAQLELTTRGTGAVVMGRTLFDFVDGPHGWTPQMGYGADLAETPPFVVVTSSAPDVVRLRETHDFTFVTDGLGAAVARAREVAGECDVVVMGGGAVVRGCLEAGLLDRLRLHLAPVVLGGGTALLQGCRHHDLRQREVQVSPHATHVTYDVVS